MSSDYLAEPVPLHIPAGVMMSSTRYEPRHRRVEVLCTDRSWRQAEILAWAKHRAGWAALIRWPDGSQDWRKHDRRFIRPALSVAVPCAGLSSIPAIPAGVLPGMSARNR